MMRCIFDNKNTDTTQYYHNLIVQFRSESSGNLNQTSITSLNISLSLQSKNLSQFLLQSGFCGPSHVSHDMMEWGGVGGAEIWRWKSYNQGWFVLYSVDNSIYKKYQNSMIEGKTIHTFSFQVLFRLVGSIVTKTLSFYFTQFWVVSSKQRPFPLNFWVV